MSGPISDATSKGILVEIDVAIEPEDIVGAVPFVSFPVPTAMMKELGAHGTTLVFTFYK
jgi:hypothetical protein